MQTKVKKIIPTDNLLVQIDKYIKPRTKDITVFEGSVTLLTPTNIRVINPIKILVKTSKFTYVILHYGVHSNDENDIFLYTKNNKISWLKLIDILKNAQK